MRTGRNILGAALAVCALAAAPSVAVANHILPPIQKGSVAVGLVPVATDMAAPDYAIHAPGAAEANRLWVVEQNGQLRIIQDGSLLPDVALDLGPRMAGAFNPANANDERGFLGLAFHPDYATPGAAGHRTLYTYSTEPIPVGSSPTFVAPNNATQGYKLVVNEWKIDVANPNRVDPNSRREVVSFGKNANNHNGGTIAFGPDGYLYLAVGDGGNANDVGPSHIEPGGNAQNLTTPLGKMLRFDPINPSLKPAGTDPVAPNGQYRIPADNPFLNTPHATVKEVWAFGLRNPYRFAFDRLNGQLILADVGQRNIEEIDRIERGRNYGWGLKEGTFTFNRVDGTIGVDAPGTPSDLTDPIKGALGTLQYDHGDGISITGGFVYRGTAIPELYGKYVFGDLALRTNPQRVDGRLFYADLVLGTINEFRIPQFANDQLPDGLTVHGFGEDAGGELYALVTNTPANGTGGIVYKFAAVPEPGAGLTLLTLSGLLVSRRRR